MNFKDIFCFEIKEVFFQNGEILELNRKLLDCHNSEDLINESVLNRVRESNDFSDFLVNKDILSENYKKMFSGEIKSFKEFLKFKLSESEIIEAVSYGILLEKKTDSIVVLMFFTTNDKENFDLFDFFIRNKFVGVVIYQNDKIIFSNKIFRDMTGYKASELKEKEFSSIFSNEMINTIKDFSKKRNEGKSIEKYFAAVPIRAKDGYTRYFDLYDTTIRLKGKLTGSTIFIDVSEKELLKDFYNILHGISKLIYISKKKEDLFSSVCEYLSSKDKIKFTWIGEIRDDKIVSVAKAGYEEGFLEKINLSNNFLTQNINKLKKGEIIFLSNTTIGLEECDCKIEMVKRRYMSAICIPLSENNEYKYILTLFLTEPYDFNDYLIKVLEAIQYDLSYYLSACKEREYKEYLFTAVENTNDWVVITDKDGYIEYANAAVEKISGYKQDEIIGKTPRIFKSGLHDEKFYEMMWEKIKKGEIYKAVIINKAKNGEFFQLNLSIIPIIENGEVIKYVSIARDITYQQMLENEIKRFKYHDLKTDLLNRKGFIKESSKLLEKIKNIDRLKMIAVIDIYDFSSLNGILGQYACDNLLKIIAEKLKDIFKDKAVIARIGSDEFAIFTMIKDDNESVDILTNILKVFNNGIDLFNNNIKINLNIGVDFITDDKSIEDALKRSEIALNFSKKEGANVIKYYDENINKRISSYFERVNLVVNALKNDWFIFHYQPIFDTFTGEVNGFEALVRINHPEKGLIFPNAFIDLLENELDLLISFEEYLLDTITKQILDFKKETNIMPPENETGFFGRKNVKGKTR